MEEQFDPYVDQFQASLIAIWRKLGPDLVEKLNVGVTAPQFFMLKMIHSAGKCKLTFLADKMEVKPSAITVMIDRLVQVGIVERKQDEQDRRVVLVQLTDYGVEVLNKVQLVRKRMMQHILASFPQEELTMFVETLEKISKVEIPYKDIIDELNQ